MSATCSSAATSASIDLQAAVDQTNVTKAQITDEERSLIFNVGQQFVAVLLAESTLRFAELDLKSFQQYGRHCRDAIQSGIHQRRRLPEDQAAASAVSDRRFFGQIARVQGLVALRVFLGYDAVPANYDVVGDLAYAVSAATVDDLQAKALQKRPDYRASVLGVTAAQSQIALAQANGKQDVNTTFDYTHTAGENSASFFLNFGMPFFNRNQGEIARTKYALLQAQETQASTSDTVLSDVSSAYEALRSNEEIVQLYISGYLKQAQDSRDISEYAYKRGATSLLDFLDAERSNRATQLAYRQALAALHDGA